MNNNDIFIQIGSVIDNILTKTRKRVCNETILCNSNNLYMTIEPRLTLTDPVHHYVCRYVRKNKNSVYLKSMKTFVISISFTDELKFGINTNGDICDYEIIFRFVNLLSDMYRAELDKFNKGAVVKE